MFGGEGAANIDLDDLWVFNVESKKWSELKTTVKSNEKKDSIVKMEGRKFHSTAMIDHRLYVVSGCKMNYNCLPSICSVDLEALFKSSQDKKEN